MMTMKKQTGVCMMQFIDELMQITGEKYVLTSESMKKHTTFRVGGPADYFVMPEDKEMLRKIVLLCKDRGVNYFTVGKGSNLLVGDKGIRGVVINTCRFMDDIYADGDIITVSAGCTLAKAARTALSHSLSGLEFAAGIPGTLGGAVVMNAGAYGSDISQVIIDATVLTRDGYFKKLTNDELELGYRKSCIEKNGYIVTDARFKLVPGDSEKIAAYMDELAKRRREKQPLEYPSAGSTFKRPEGYFAGKLIMDSGLAGFRVGGASISSKHCGFVINDEEGTASDILELCRKTSDIVYNKFGVELEMEVKKVGEF